MFFSFGRPDTPNDARRVMDAVEVFGIRVAAFERRRRQGGYANLLRRPLVSGHAPRVDRVQRLIERMKTRPGVWSPT